VRLKIAAACVFLATSFAIAAHHSFAIYDDKRPITVTGVVKEFRWTNPHSWLFVIPDDGREAAWEIELGPINMLSRQGWTRSTFEPGDRVAVEIHPAHSGQRIGRFISFKQVGEGNRGQLADFATSTITRVPRPEPVPMTDAIARDFNGMWVNANGGIHFDTAVSRESQTPPLKPEYMARWRQRATDAAAGRSTTDPTAQCLPAGFPRFLSMVFPGEILQAPHQLNWYAEWGEATLRIYLDGRSPPANLQPSYYGYTSGRWEGAALVTRTIGLRDDTLVDTTGIPHSDQLTVAMRFKKLTPDYFEVNVTLDDPVVFERPWSTVKRFARAPADYYVQEYACFEGNRYRIGADGSVQVGEESAPP
jgi:uncharacterized protein DUF6152